jgi:predicted secreted protein
MGNQDSADAQLEIVDAKTTLPFGETVKIESTHKLLPCSFATCSKSGPSSLVYSGLNLDNETIDKYTSLLDDYKNVYAKCRENWLEKKDRNDLKLCQHHLDEQFKKLIAYYNFKITKFSFKKIDSGGTQIIYPPVRLFLDQEAEPIQRSISKTENLAAVTSPIVIDGSQNNTAINVNKGDLIVVRLGENPTTGYRWNLIVSSGLDLIGTDYQRADVPKDLVGSGGTRSWNIRATTSGEQTISAVYHRPWESTVGSTFDVWVIVA